MNSLYLIAPVVGLLGALHCAGMCGGIVGALSLSLPARARQPGGRLLAFTLAYNLGRVASYALAGALTSALFGGFGVVVSLVGGDSGAGLLAGLLRALAGTVTVGIGLYLLGWLPRFALIERLGEPLWALLEPHARRLLPVRTLPRAVLFGALWGWLPCGLSYAVLLSTPAAGGPLAGAAIMALFGLGTLPVMLAGGLLAGRLYGLAGRRRLQMAGGALVLVLGLSTLTRQWI